MALLMMKSTPKYTGSMPAALTTGISTGVRIRMVGVMSMAVPTTMTSSMMGGGEMDVMREIEMQRNEMAKLRLDCDAKDAKIRQLEERVVDNKRPMSASRLPPMEGLETVTSGVMVGEEQPPAAAEEEVVVAAEEEAPAEEAPVEEEAPAAEAAEAAEAPEAEAPAEDESEA